jgi:hypothetical protein
MAMSGGCPVGQTWQVEIPCNQHLHFQGIFHCSPQESHGLRVGQVPWYRLPLTHQHFRLDTPACHPGWEQVSQRMVCDPTPYIPHIINDRDGEMFWSPLRCDVFWDQDFYEFVSYFIIYNLQDFWKNMFLFYKSRPFWGLDSKPWQTQRLPTGAQWVCLKVSYNYASPKRPSEQPNWWLTIGTGTCSKFRTKAFVRGGTSSRA